MLLVGDLSMYTHIHTLTQTHTHTRIHLKTYPETNLRYTPHTHTPIPSSPSSQFYAVRVGVIPPALRGHQPHRLLPLTHQALLCGNKITAIALSIFTPAVKPHRLLPLTHRTGRDIHNNCDKLENTNNHDAQPQSSPPSPRSDSTPSTPRSWPRYAPSS